MTQPPENQNAIILYYKRHFLNVELGIATILTILILLVIIKELPPFTLDTWVLSIKYNLYPVIATISGALLGFVITGVSVIIAFTESDKFRLLRKTTTYKKLFEVYFRTIYYLAGTTLISAIGIVITNYSTFWFYLLVWSAIISAFGLYRCIWILENLVEILTKKE